MELYLMQKRSLGRKQDLEQNKNLMMKQNPEQNWNLKAKQPSLPPDKPGIHR